MFYKKLKQNTILLIPDKRVFDRYLSILKDNILKKYVSFVFKLKATRVVTIKYNLLVFSTHPSFNYVCLIKEKQNKG